MIRLAMIFTLAFSLSSWASKKDEERHETTCYDQMQGQLEELAYMPYIEILESRIVTVDESDMMGDIIASVDGYEPTFPADVLVAKTGAMGCQGSEYVFYDSADCAVLAVGGGYCE